MTTDELTRFRVLLGSAVTGADRRESKREERNPNLRVNIYRLGHYLEAADEVAALVATGVEPAVAFAKHFAPTREMHRVARAMNLPLDVERGNWVRVNPAPATA